MITNASTLEIKPAAPIQIPQIQVVLPLPQQWADFAISQNVDLARDLESWVTGFPGHISPRLCDRHCETFLTKEARCGWEASEAISNASANVGMTISRDLWNLFVLAASNVGKPSHYVLLVILADAMRFERECGAEVRELYARIRKQTASESAQKPAAPGRVISGPWKNGSSGASVKPASRKEPV